MSNIQFGDSAIGIILAPPPPPPPFVYPPGSYAPPPVAFPPAAHVPGLRLDFEGQGQTLFVVSYQSGRSLVVQSWGAAADLCATTPWALMTRLGMVASLAGAYGQSQFGFTLSVPAPTVITPGGNLASLTIGGPTALIQGVTATTGDVAGGVSLTFLTLGLAAQMAGVDPLALLAALGGAPGVTWQPS